MRAGHAIAARGFALDYLRTRFAGPVGPDVFASLDRRLEKLRVDRAAVEPLRAAAFQRSPPPIALAGRDRLQHLVQAYAATGQADAAVGGIVDARTARVGAAT